MLAFWQKKKMHRDLERFWKCKGKGKRKEIEKLTGRDPEALSAPDSIDIITAELLLFFLLLLLLLLLLFCRENNEGCRAILRERKTGLELSTLCEQEEAKRWALLFVFVEK